MKKPTLISVYKMLLKLVGLTTSKKGEIEVESGSNVKVNRKMLVLPMDRYLRKSVMNKVMVFHPMAEDITLKPSLIVKSFNKSAHSYYTYLLTNLILEILDIKQKDDNISITDKVFMSKFKDVSTNDVITANKVLVSDRANMKYPLLSMDIKDNVRIEGIEHLRGCMVSSPLLKKLESIIEENISKPEVNGVKMTKRSVAALHSLIDVILPEINEMGFSKGSAGGTAPSIMAITRTCAKFIKYIQKAAVATGEIPGSMYDVDTSFLDKSFFKGKQDELKMMIGTVPSVQGNKGSVNKTLKAPKVLREAVNINGPIVNKRKKKKKNKKKKNKSPWDAHKSDPVPWDENDNTYAVKPSEVDDDSKWDVMFGSQPGVQQPYVDPWSNNQPQQSMAWGQPQQSMAWGQPQQSNGWGQPQQSTAWGQPQQSNGWGQPQQSNGWHTNPWG